MPFFSRPPFFGGPRKDIPDGQWKSCPECKKNLHKVELEENLWICPACDYHFTIQSDERIQNLVDKGTFEEMDAHLKTVDALGFPGYQEKIERSQKRSGLNEAVVTGKAKIKSHPVYLGVMDFRYLGASMGSVVGEKLTRAIEAATRNKAAVIIFSASGGARMHEGILSLMQMAKTSGALARHSQACLPYISVLTHPTTGGVTASFATLGDVILAEPKCMIGFAGPRVIKETTHQDLPPGFQTAEFMMKHGLVDRIVHRAEMRKTIANLLGYMLPKAEAVS